MITFRYRYRFSVEAYIRFAGYITFIIIGIIKSGDFARGEDWVVILVKVAGGYLMLLIIIGIANCMIAFRYGYRFSVQTYIRFAGYIANLIVFIVDPGNFACSARLTGSPFKPTYDSEVAFPASSYSLSIPAIFLVERTGFPSSSK